MYLFRNGEEYAFERIPYFSTYMAWRYKGVYKRYLVFSWGYWNLRLWRIEK